MSTPQQWLEEILSATESLLQDESLNHQQVTFIKAIQSCANQLENGFSLIPQKAIEKNHIFSEIGLESRSGITSIRGYSEMLISYPAQFGATGLNGVYKKYLIQIRDNIEKLRQWKLSLVEYAETYRQKMHKAPPHAIDLNRFFEDYVPQYQYLLKLLPEVSEYSDVSVELVTEIPSILPFVKTNPYHLSYLFFHVFRTIAELSKVGTIHLSAAVEGQFVVIKIHSETLSLTAENIDILFDKQGRHIYRERLEAQGGKINIPSETQIDLYVARS